jgi:hypothetical protein
MFIIMRNFIILVSILFFCASCKKSLLSPEQVNLVYNEVFWSSENDAEKAVLGSYSLYRGLMVSAQMYNRGDVTTGYLNRGWNGGSSDALYKPGNFSDVSGNQKSWGGYESYADWHSFYKVVAQLNLVITKIENMPANLFNKITKESLLGEAYFLRALTYYNIACIWGNAPLVLEAIESSDQVIDKDNILITRARSSDIEIMDAVLSDIGKAVDFLEFGIPGSATWGIRANKGSALALMGYSNLWMGFLKERDGLPFNEHTQAAIVSLENLVQNGRYDLVPYTDKTTINNLFKGQSSEAVFELNINANQGETFRVDAGGIEFLTCKIMPLDGDETKDRASNINFVPASQKLLVYPEYPADKRADLFWEAWDSNYNEPFSDVSQVAVDRNKVTWMTKFASFVEDPAREWNEYVAYFAESNIPVFRFTDVKLLLAEAYAKNNNQTAALSIVNEIRNRAGLLNYNGSDVLQEVLQQRTSELIGEGKLFFDYVRNNHFPNVSSMTPERYAAKGYYWPVSRNILTINKAVQQTPYWNGKTTW